MNEAEFSCVGTVPEARVPALLTALAERCGAPASELRSWERRYLSSLPPDKRGLGEMRLVSDGRNVTLRTESVERLTISQLVATRETPILQARRVARVPVGDGASHLVAALGFEPAHEALRRGCSFRQDGATISVFEVCRRRAGSVRRAADEETAGDDDEWEAVGDGSLKLVEVLLHGTGELAPLATAADAWVDMLDKMVMLQPAQGHGRR
jgi:hypothetical protein